MTRAFSWKGRTFAANDRLQLLNPRAKIPNAGIIACFRPTSGQAAAFGFATNDALTDTYWMVGRNGTSLKFQLRNANGVRIEHPSVDLDLNKVHVGMAFSATSTLHWLALDHIKSLTKITSSFVLQNVGALTIGANLAQALDPTNFVGQMFWLGVLARMPPTNLLAPVLAQQASPLILEPYLAHLIPMLGRSPERCILTGQAMTVDAGTSIASIPTLQPQLRSRTWRRFVPTTGKAIKLYASRNDAWSTVQELVSTTRAVAVLVRVPVAGETEAKLGIDGQAMQVVAMGGAANAQTGGLVIGTGIVDGAIQSEAGSANVRAVALATGTSAALEAELWAVARRALAPVIGTIPLSGPSATDNVIDLAAYISDPAGAGYTISATSADPTVDLGIAVTTLTYRRPAVGTATIAIQVDSSHPLGPSARVEIDATFSLASGLYPNGYKFRRLITRAAVPGAQNNSLTRFPIPVRLSAQTWAKSLANGGKLEGVGGVIDVRAERADGTQLAQEVEEGYDAAAGTGVVHVGAPTWNPTAAFSFYLYYGKPGSTVSDDDWATLWQDYHDVKHGPGTRNPAAPSRPWTSTAGNAAGTLGRADDHSTADASVSLGSSSHWNGLTELDFTMAVKRPVSTGSAKGLIGVGNLTDDSTAAVSIRDALTDVAGSTNNTVLASINTTAGRAVWRGSANLQSTSWQAWSWHWKSGQALKAFLNGSEIADSGSNPVRTGTTNIAGTVAIGAAGLLAGNGRWVGQLDELRVSKVIRGTNWRLVEHLSLTDAAFVSIGAEETPGASPDTFVANDDAVTVVYSDGGSVLVDVLANDVHSTGAAKSITSVGTPSSGSAAIESGQIRYTWPAGFAAGGTASLLYTASAAALSDSANLEVTVLAEPPPSDIPKYPPAGSSGTVYASPSGGGTGASAGSPMTLTAALSSASARRIKLVSGTYAGNYSVSRSGTASAPIIIESVTHKGAIFTGTITVTGDYVWLTGLTSAKNGQDPSLNSSNVIYETPGYYGIVLKGRFNYVTNNWIRSPNGIWIDADSGARTQDVSICHNYFTADTAIFYNKSNCIYMGRFPNTSRGIDRVLIGRNKSRITGTIPAAYRTSSQASRTWCYTGNSKSNTLAVSFNHSHRFIENDVVNTGESCKWAIYTKRAAYYERNWLNTPNDTLIIRDSIDPGSTGPAGGVRGIAIANHIIGNVNADTGWHRFLGNTFDGDVSLQTGSATGLTQLHGACSRVTLIGNRWSASAKLELGILASSSHTTRADLGHPVRGVINYAAGITQPSGSSLVRINVQAGTAGYQELTGSNGFVVPATVTQAELTAIGVGCDP